MSDVAFPAKLLSEQWDCVYGTEQELCPEINPNNYNANFPLEDLTFPKGEFFSNGGKAYLDMNEFYEVCSPETQNPLAAVLYNRAMLHLAKKLNPTRKFLRNGAESNGFTSGYHENFFTTLSIEERYHLVPFLISLQPLIGGGLLDPQDKSYRIHQRGPHILSLKEEVASIKRGILDLRMEPLSEVDGFYRMHQVLNDPSMCVFAEFLRISTTALMIKALEQRVITPLDYDLDKSIEDLHAIGTSMSAWELSGTRPKPMSAVQVQSYFLNQIREHLHNKTPLTKFILDAWEHSLELLSANDPDYLIGYNDWATKRWLLNEQAMSYGCSIYDTPCQALEYEYHTLQFGKESLFQFFEKLKDFPMRIPNQLIYNASKKPPNNTRALARGLAVENFHMSRYYSAKANWNRIDFYKYEENTKTRVAFLEMKDPRKTYLDDLKKIINNI